MKKLTKIKLINWYTFQNQTIEIKGNVLVSGQNSSGKSTLLDAIQYVLTGGKQKFNQAANEKSARTLESYIRGKTNLENQKYIREGDVTAYIALEFENDNKTRKDIIGAVIETTSSTKLNRSFFKITNTDLTDSLFIEDNAPKTLWSFKHTKTPKIEIFDTKTEIQQMICSVLGLNGTKYFELLLKAIFFKPINDLNEFVNNFLLPEKNVSIDNLRQNVEELRELLDIIELEENKVKSLEQIETKYNEYLSNQEELNKNNWLKKKIYIEKELRVINNLKSIITKNTSKVSNLIKEKQDNITKLTLKENLKKQYQDSHTTNEETSLYFKLESNLNTLKTELSTQEILYNNYKNSLHQVTKNLSIFTWTNELKNLDLSNTTTLKAILTNINEFATNARNSLVTSKLDHEKKKNEVNEKIKYIESILNKLKMKRLPYDDTVINLQTTIKEELSKKYNENIEVRPLCEYLDITNEDWRDAIEGYLNNQRFDLIIEPKYFDEALRIYDNYKLKKKIYGVGLVNTKKLTDQELTENSLATHITSNNIYATRYAYNILNKVICCNKLEDLKNHKQAITKTCMTYRNYVARQINPKVYEYYFIGKKAPIQQQHKYKEANTMYQDLKDDLTKKINTINNQYNRLNNSNITNLIQEIPVIEKYNNLILQIEDINNNISNLKVEGILNNIKEEISKFDEDINNIKDTINNLSTNITRLQLEIENTEQEITKKEEYISSIPDTLNINHIWEEELSNIINSNLDKKELEIDNKISKLTNSLKQQEINLISILNEYNYTYQYEELTTLENINSYLQELSKIREQDLIKHKSDVIKFKEQCQITFREDFISQIKDKILSTKEEINNLNKSLKKQTFGKEKYEFIIKKSDNPEMATYYDIIVSGANYNIHNLFEDNLTIEEQDTMDALFERLTASHTLDSTNKLVEEYTDYRKYMSYDIKVTNEEGNYYYLSNSLREKSGGELQTPFYVIIASSFEQLLKNGRREDSVGCIVIFDEAFNNMDESRIGAMMKFYSDLKIQLIIAVPPSKLANIAPYTNTTLIVNRNKNTSYVHRFTYEELLNNE